VANEIEVVEPAEPLPQLPVARAVWRPAPDLRTSTEAWLTAGGPHHTVLSSAVGAEELTDLADMLGTELLLIDADTTVRQFAKEIRWNQAYYRLAGGL
jgi:L-arabinose isomerase